MLRPAHEAAARIVGLVMAFGRIVRVIWIGSRATAVELVAAGGMEDQLKHHELRYESLLQVLRGAVLVLSVIFVWLCLVGMMMTAMAAYTLNDWPVDCDVDLGDTLVPQFTQVKVRFEQAHSDATTLPLTGSAAINIDGDGTEELFIKNGDNTFANETNVRGLSYLHNTFQATFGDFEGDGDLDLIVAHDTGNVRTYANDGAGHFAMTTNPDTDIPSYPMGIGITDINNDDLTDYSFFKHRIDPVNFHGAR